MLALLRAPGIGSVRFARLLEHFGSAGAVFAADRAELKSLELPDAALDYLHTPDWRPWNRISPGWNKLITICYRLTIRAIPTFCSKFRTHRRYCLFTVTPHLCGSRNWQ
jgi:hypothetical protein